MKEDDGRLYSIYPSRLTVSGSGQLPKRPAAEKAQSYDLEFRVCSSSHARSQLYSHLDKDHCSKISSTVYQSKPCDELVQSVCEVFLPKIC